MRSLALVAAVAGICLLIASGASNDPISERVLATSPIMSATPLPALAPSHSHAIAPEDLNAVVQQYCVVCHNDALLTGRLTLQTFDVAAAAAQAPTAEKMIRKLRAGMMPPPGLPRPAGDTLVQLVQTLENTVDAAARANPNVGVRRFPRLSEIDRTQAIALTRLSARGLALQAEQELGRSQDRLEPSLHSILEPTRSCALATRHAAETSSKRPPSRPRNSPFVP
jgi:hypothetical protein